MTKQPTPELIEAVRSGGLIGIINLAVLQADQSGEDRSAVFHLAQAILAARDAQPTNPVFNHLKAHPEIEAEIRDRIENDKIVDGPTEADPKKTCATCGHFGEPILHNAQHRCHSPERLDDAKRQYNKRHADHLMIYTRPDLCCHRWIAIAHGVAQAPDPSACPQTPPAGVTGPATMAEPQSLQFPQGSVGLALERQIADQRRRVADTLKAHKDVIDGLVERIDGLVENATAVAEATIAITARQDAAHDKLSDRLDEGSKPGPEQVNDQPCGQCQYWGVGNGDGLPSICTSFGAESVNKTCSAFTPRSGVDTISAPR